MVGAGTFITCSWQYLPSPIRVVYLAYTGGDAYQLNPASDINRGMGVLTDTVGWLGEDKLFVYINKTEKRHMSTYLCIVVTADIHVLLSNFFELIVNGKDMFHYDILLRCCLINTCLRAVW